MYPMVDQSYQWASNYGYEPSSVDSGRPTKSHASKSSSSDKEGKKDHHKGGKNGNKDRREVNFQYQHQGSHNGQNQAQAAPVNQFVPVYMLPPGFSGHPGAFNAALAAHAASQQTAPNSAMYQMPTYGHYTGNAGNPYVPNLPYGYTAGAGHGHGGPDHNGHHHHHNKTKFNGYYNGSPYSGSDYNSHSGTGSHSGTSPSTSHRGSRSSDSAHASHGGRNHSNHGGSSGHGGKHGKHPSRSLTSRDSSGANSSGHHSAHNNANHQGPHQPHGASQYHGQRKNSVRIIGTKKNLNVKKFQSTHQITISKNVGPKGKQPAVKQNSCGRSHSIGSDLSAGCSASACHAQTLNRSCSNDSHGSASRQSSNELHRTNTVVKRKITGCCSNECDHFGPIFENMRKFSNNQEFKKPDTDLTKKLIELIEFYLSDEYLAKDKYLLRQIRCKSEGYISIKLMTSFKKVKKLTRDWRTVRFALLQTDKLIVSPEGFRVKRATQLPDNLRKPRLLSSVVTIRLTEELSSVDAITQTFSKYGEIGLVRILKPGKEIPSDLRNYATQVPDIGKTMCAVVDFEQSESALQAVRCLKDSLLEQKMRLALLGPRVRRTLYKQDRSDKDEDDIEDEDLEHEEPVDTSSAVDGGSQPTVSLDSTDNLESKASTDKNTALAKAVTESGPDSIKQTNNNNKAENINKAKTNNSNSKKTTAHRVDSSDSNLSKNLDISVDSGNCNASGTHSNDEDIITNDMQKVSLNSAVDPAIKHATLQRENSKDSTATTSSSKTSNIYREPEGPKNADVLGFAFKRSGMVEN